MSQTSTTAPMPTRQYDHLYDNVYTVSSSRTHYRTEQQSFHTQTMRVPDSDNMFSDLQRYPRYREQIKRVDKVPASVVRDFATITREKNEQLAKDNAKVDQRGKQFALFFDRPNPVSYSNTSHLKLQSVQPKQAEEAAKQLTGKAKVRTVGTQSMYRESEAQTDPWTPQHVVRPGSAPEVLRLATFTYGNGLPAGLHEVVMIERARAKREWEKTLPDINDPEMREKRIQMMEEQDAREWKWREEELEQIQAERLRVLQDALEETNQHYQSTMTLKIDEKLAQDAKRQAVTDEARQQSGLRTLRKIQNKQETAGQEQARSSKVEDYSNGASWIYTEEGTLSHEDIKKIVTNNYVNTYQGLLELESSLPYDLTNPRLVSPPKGKKPVGGKAHQNQRYSTMLDNLSAKFDTTKRNLGTSPPKPRFLERVPTPPVRPPVPRVKPPEEGFEQGEASMLLLQRVLRGRSVQNSMQEGREQRQDLISELRTTHALEVAEQSSKLANEEEILLQRSNRAAATHEHKKDQSIVGEIAGETVGHTLDYLSKELTRLQEERRVHAFVMLAEKQRRVREAEETGQRQKDELLRRKQEEVFREVCGIQQQSVDTYLEDILLGANANIADEGARVEIRKKAQAIDSVAQKLHDEGVDQTEIGALSIAADLMSSFLIPEAQRMKLRQKLKSDQQKFLDSAHHELYNHFVE